jgi:hypothetical protein
MSREAALRSQETEKQFREMSKEAAVRSKERNQQLKKLEKNLGGLGNSMGELIETLIAGRLWEKFSSYKFNFKRAYRRVQVFSNEHKELTDIDILLSDTEWVMAVEVKRNPSIKEVDRHIKRMKLIRENPPAEVMGKNLLGAIAGGIVAGDVKNYAHKAGFFVLELRGESVSLIEPPKGFCPKAW